MQGQRSCRFRLRDLSRDTNCGTAYEYGSPVAGGQYRLSGLRWCDTSGWVGWHHHTLAEQKPQYITYLVLHTAPLMLPAVESGFARVLQ